MTAHTDHVWRAYDIRGDANTEITPIFSLRLGWALARLFQAFGAEEIAVARDARITSPLLHSKLIDGLRQGGVDVYDIGEAPTPALYFAVDGLGFDAGVVVTASHNPSKDNGYKIRINGGEIFSKEIQFLKKWSERYEPQTDNLGSIERVSIQNVYIDAIVDACQPAPKRFKVAIDAGNGVTGPWAIDLFTKMGCEVIPIHCEPDGRFPNHRPDPTKPKNMVELRETVLAKKADIGFGFDGDGDRLGIVTAQGELIYGDRLMAIFARDLLRWKTGGIVADLKCSNALNDVVSAHGGHIIRSKTGYPWIQKVMREHYALMAGEHSSHICFADWFGFDDGLYAAARMIRLLPELENILAEIPRYFSTPELRLHVPESMKFEIANQLKHNWNNDTVIDLDGIRVENDQGWALIRPSNTEAVLTVRVEAKTQKGFRDWIGVVDARLQDVGIDSKPLRACLSST